jgi:bacterioferritin-associated ferredoxin
VTANCIYKMMFLDDNDSYYTRSKHLYICICNAITERQVRDCARSGASSVDQLASELGVGSGCGRCLECAVDLLREMHAGSDPKTSSA